MKGSNSCTLDPVWFLQGREEKANWVKGEKPATFSVVVVVRDRKEVITK